MPMTLLSRRAMRWLLTFGVLCTLAHAVSGAQDVETKGSLIMIGGALRYDNAAVWNKVVELAGGADASIAVFASAAGNPKASGAFVIDALNKAGAKAFFVPVAVKLTDSDYRQAASDPQWVAKVKSAKGVYFTGGDQSRITQALRLENGANTPMLDAIWSVYRNGGVIAGSSAGAAVMSTHMFHDAMPVLDTLKSGVGRAGVMAPGLGFIGPGVFIDQHLFTRGRFARMMPAMLAKGYPLGLGVDENTAAVVTSGGQVEIIGYKGALVVDLAGAKATPSTQGLDVRDVRLSYLDRGDRFDLVTKAFTPSPEKALRKLDPTKPYNKTPRYYPDILGNTTVVDLMQNLIDNAQEEVIGLAFSGPDGPAPEKGYEFRFRKGADSVGYFTGAYGGEDYSVVNIYLDVRPVEMSLPLYRQPIAR